MNDKKDTVVLLVLVSGNVSEAARQDIRTKGATQSYRDGWDNVFAKREGKEVVN